MPIPCKLPILKNISYVSGIMFGFSLLIPLITDTPSTVDTNSLIILSLTGMIISFGIGMKIRKYIGINNLISDNPYGISK